MMNDNMPNSFENYTLIDEEGILNNLNKFYAVGGN